MEPQKETPKEETKEEAGIHKDREARPQQEQQTPTRGEPLSEADRDRGNRRAPPPASEPRE